MMVLVLVGRPEAAAAAPMVAPLQAHAQGRPSMPLTVASKNHHTHALLHIHSIQKVRISREF